MDRLTIAVYVVVDLLGRALDHRVGTGDALACGLPCLVDDVEGEVNVVALAAQKDGIVDGRAEVDASRVIKRCVKSTENQVFLGRVFLVFAVRVLGGKHQVAIVRLVVSELADLAVKLLLNKPLYRLARETTKLLVINVLAPVFVD